MHKVVLLLGGAFKLCLSVRSPQYFGLESHVVMWTISFLMGSNYRPYGDDDANPKSKKI